MNIIKRGPLSADEAHGLAEMRMDELGAKEADELIKELQHSIKEEASKGMFTTRISVGRKSALVRGGFMNDVVAYYHKLGFKVSLLDVNDIEPAQTIVVSWE
ncbi:hypothetical protein [Halalkalibacterium halodurans]|uniref:hypothetical protein n=1 Tax=Halalkalibacterium halodurans TaxID=86665 RepID=UPI002AAA0E41|nr:hypothetical protein [Halalkalibacterium halodurans]MDY7222108.1 hypothetical protein [Halalkalibacterium halodurans]MDY7243873.1 hypothetical protein [Halalkalibacterium halodurans]